MNSQARGGGNSNCRWAGILIVAGHLGIDPTLRVRFPASLTIQEEADQVFLEHQAYLSWCVSPGGEAEAEETGQRHPAPRTKTVGQDTPALPDLEPGAGEQARRTGGRPEPPTPRIWSVFGRGWNLLRNALAVGVVLIGSWHPEAWPDHPHAGLPPTTVAHATATEATQDKSDQSKISLKSNGVHRLDSS